MNKTVTMFVLAGLIFGAATELIAQREFAGKQSDAGREIASSVPARKVDKSATVFVGPVFPPPLPFNWISLGPPGASGRLGGRNWYFSGVQLAGSTTVYWGPTGLEQLLSMDGGSFSPAESMHISGTSDLPNGLLIWTGSSQFYNKFGVGPIFVATSFVMTITDSTTGNPIALTSPGSLGLPADVGGVVPVTAGLHWRANLQFTAGGLPSLDFFDANALANFPGGPATSSFRAGFYYNNVAPSITSLPDTTTKKNIPIGPISFTVGDVETPVTALATFATSSNTTLVPNVNISIVGGLATRDISVNPATDQIGSTTINVGVTDGLDTTYESFVLTVELALEFQVSPGSLNLGDVLIGNSKTDSVEVSNPGTDALHITSVSSTHPHFGVSPGGGTVAGGSGMKFYVTYTPTTSASESGAIIFGHDADTSPDSVPVSGAGINGMMFRTIRHDSLAFDKDNKGKLNKPVKRKGTRVFFTAKLVNTTVGANALHADFGTGIDQTLPFTIDPPATKTPTDLKSQKWDFAFSGALSVGDTVKITGYGNKGKLQKVGKYYWKIGGIQSSPNLKNPLIDPNVLRLPMANRVNILYESYLQGGFLSTNGLLVGKVRTGPPDSSKKYGWVLHKKYTDVMKSVFDSKSAPQTHDGVPRGFDFFKAQGKLIKSKHNNALFANLAALKLAVTASALGITPPGLGELKFDDGTSNPLNGRHVKDLIQIGDSIVMGYYLAGVHVFLPSGEFQNLNTVVAKIDSAFEGPMDTTSFWSSLVVPGVRPLYEVDFLHADSMMVPERITPTYTGITESPVEYTLYQNFPNPFNPTTTIQFDLAEPAFVSLKVYNILGQEVEVLVDNQEMDDGIREVAFDASRLTSGVYFYRLMAQTIPDEDGEIALVSTVITKKMLLIK